MSASRPSRSSPPPARRAPASGVLPRVAPAGPTVALVVDDEDDLRALYAEILRTYGVFVVTASSAERARELLRTVRPDVVVTDFSMPGSSGLELLHQLRAEPELAALSLVLMSAHGDPELPGRAAEVGASFLAKPFEIDALVSIVRSRR